SYIHAIFRAGWILAICSAVIFQVGTPFWAKGLEEVQHDKLVSVIFILLTLSNYLMGLQDAVMLSQKRGSFIFWRNVAANLPSFLLLLLIAPFTSSSTIPLLAYSIPNILICLVAGFNYLPGEYPGFRMWGTFDWGVLKQVSGYSLSNYSANLIWGASSQILPLMAVNFLSSSEVAYFYITWSVFNFLLVIPRGVTSSLFIQHVDQPVEMRSGVSRSLLLIFSLTIPTILFLSLAGPLILSMFGKNYVQTGSLTLLLLSSIPFSINSIYFTVKRVRKELLTLNIFSIFLTFLIVIFAHYFSRQIGIRGLAAGWLVSQLICAGFVVAFYALKTSMHRINLKFNPSE
ncbi:MAG: hypothetical protein ACWGO1_14660, partial [Anaerolineales bacterium]